MAEFRRVNANLPPPIIVPHGWTQAEGAGTLPLGATATKAQRDVPGRGPQPLCKIPFSGDPSCFHSTEQFSDVPMGVCSYPFPLSR